VTQLNVWEGPECLKYYFTYLILRYFEFTIISGTEQRRNGRSNEWIDAFQFENDIFTRTYLFEMFVIRTNILAVEEKKNVKLSF
jgi:hypothetical protein